MAAYGIGAAAGGFADGFIKGRMLREQINSNKMEKKLNEQRLRDAERENSEKDRLAAARQALTSGLQSLEADYGQGSGEFSAFMPEKMGVTAPGQQPAGGLQQPDKPKSPWANPGAIYRDSAGAEAMYQDRIGSLYKNYFAQTDQPERALAVDDTISKMRENKTDRLVKGAAAAMYVGAPEALGLLDRVSSVAGLGRVDTKSGKFDPKTRTWTGVNFFQTDGSKVTRDFTPSDMMSLAYYGDPARHFEQLNEKSYRDRMATIQDTSARNESARVANEGKRLDMQLETSNREAEDRAEDRALRRDRANVELIQRLISSSIKPPIAPNKAVFDMSVDPTASDEDRAAAISRIQKYNEAVTQYESRVESTNTMVDVAQNIMALNPGLKPQEAAYIVQNVGGKKKRGPDGQAYIEFNGKRILVP